MGVPLASPSWLAAALRRLPGACAHVDLRHQKITIGLQIACRRYDFKHIRILEHLITLGHTMQQIRISRRRDVPDVDGRSFSCEWMEACQMNRWFLKTRLAEALAAHGPESHWIESRPKAGVEQFAVA